MILNQEVNCFIFTLNLEIVSDKHPAIHLHMCLLQLFPQQGHLELLMMSFKGRSTGTYLENLWFLLADSRAAGLHSDRNQLLSNIWHKLKRQRTHRESDKTEGWRGCQNAKTAYCVFSFNSGSVTKTKGSTERQLLWNYILWKAGGNLYDNQ